MLVAGPVPGPIDDEQRFARVGQREDQRVIAPLAIVVDVHALLALAGGFDHRAVGIDDRFVEERLGLLPPDLQPRGVEHSLQADRCAAMSKRRQKSPAVVGSGMRRAPRALR